MATRFRTYRAGAAQDERDRLVLDHRWIADRCARRYVHHGEPLDDLLQVAALALVRAVERFDPEHGASFVAFAEPTILGALKRHFRDSTWRVKVPRRSRDLLASVRETADHLHQTPGRSPNADDIARALGIDRMSVVETIAADEAYRMLSTDCPADPMSSGKIADVLPAVDHSVELLDMRADLLAAIRRLDPPSRPSCCGASTRTRRSPRSPPASASGKSKSRACSDAPSTSCVTTLDAPRARDRQLGQPPRSGQHR